MNNFPYSLRQLFNSSFSLQPGLNQLALITGAVLLISLDIIWSQSPAHPNPQATRGNGFRTTHRSTQLKRKRIHEPRCAIAFSSCAAMMRFNGFITRNPSNIAGSNQYTEQYILLFLSPFTASECWTTRALTRMADDERDNSM